MQALDFETVIGPIEEPEPMILAAMSARSSDSSNLHHGHGRLSLSNLPCAPSFKNATHMRDTGAAILQIHYPCNKVRRDIEPLDMVSGASRTLGIGHSARNIICFEFDKISSVGAFARGMENTI